MSGALEACVSAIPHVELRAEHRSPIAHVRLSSMARGALTAAQQEAALRTVALVVADGADGVAIQVLI